jgi:hypothetical protein
MVRIISTQSHVYTVGSLVNVLVQILDRLDRRTNLDVDVAVVLFAEKRIIRYNPFICTLKVNVLPVPTLELFRTSFVDLRVIIPLPVLILAFLRFSGNSTRSAYFISSELARIIVFDIAASLGTRVRHSC